MTNSFLDIGTIISILKPDLDRLFTSLHQQGYEIVSSMAKDQTIVHAPLSNASALPLGYSSQQEPARFRLSRNGHQNYFDVTVGPHTWKQYFFPPKSELMTFHQEEGNNIDWSVEESEDEPPRYAMFGVRPCDLAAIEIQDKVFMRETWCDPIYRGRRENALIIVVNCMEPCGTCFCVSMETGPQARGGFDLCLTELENNFLIEIGSEAGRMVLSDENLPWQPASAFLLNTAKMGLALARENMGRELPDPETLEEQLLGNLDHPRWAEIAKRCLSCGSCTLVCPTCFCWDVVDVTSLPITQIRRVRQWDSCFNPDYSYVAHGNTRPVTRARYRQWLTHKFAGWYAQFDTSGCVGCGRCITWCPAGIDHVEEIAAIRSSDTQKRIGS